MEKSKIKINYHSDESFYSVCSFKPSDAEMTVRKNIQNAHLARRNRLHYKAKDLEKIIFRNKVNRLTTNFMKKLKYNSVYREPVQGYQKDESPIHNSESIIQKCKSFFVKIGDQQGIDIGNIGLILWSIINIVQISFMVFIFCIMMTFPETQSSRTFLYFRALSIFLYAIDMFLNFSVKRYENGKCLYKISQITLDYLKTSFSVDLISILIFPIDVLVNNESNITILISFVAIIKLVNNIKKFGKFEYLLINNSSKEHYFGLIKVLITNFAIGHILSICLNLMAGMDRNINWTTKLGIDNSDWHIKYIWGYYWGTNIMLTVGFGDIVATNEYEAIVLVFIQTFSCITLAYNINNVGALISSIRLNNQQKKKKLKTVHRMCDENFVHAEVESKIVNFIEQESRIKESFEYDEQVEVLKSLPKTLLVQFRREANKTLFDNIGFLNNLSKKSLMNLVQVILRRICHPEQIILAKGSVPDFMILQKGGITFTCKIRSLIDGMQVESMSVNKQEKPKIINFNFIKNKVLNYNIKSKGYSVLYYLSREEMMESLRNSEMDYQLFCQLKDRDECQLDQNNLYHCSVCKTEYHTKFQCNRLHFVPLKRIVTAKHVFLINKYVQQRDSSWSRKKICFKAMRITQKLKKDQKKYIEDNFDEEHYRQIQNLYNFYSHLGSSQKTQTMGEGTKTIFKTMESNGRLHKAALDQNALSRIQQILENKVNKIYNIWEFQIDLAENYNFYFREGNPDLLKTAKKSRKNKGIFNFSNGEK